VVAAEGTGKTSAADKLGIQSGMVVAEFGWGDDIDEDVRAAIEERIDGEMLDEEADDVLDVVVLWWREGDGDLIDALVDVTSPLAENGVIWVLTPKSGRDGHVEPAEIAEAVPTAGLAQTSNISAGPDWNGTRLVSPKSAKSRR
jgi:hypothetical protein